MLNSSINPTKAGRYIAVYLTGLGSVNPAIPTGVPAPSVPISLPASTISTTLGGRQITPVFAGMIPGYVGVGEVELLIPIDMEAGEQGFSITVGTASSNICQIAVAR